MHDLFSEYASPMIMHSDQDTYQTIDKTHTTAILHGENDLTMILARSSQDIANSQDHGQDPSM